MVEKRRVKFTDLRIDDSKVNALMVNVLNSGRFINGPYCEKFTIKWAKVCGTYHCVPVASGSAALISCLKVLGFRKREFVIIPRISFAATAFAVKEAGFTPLYCNVLENGLMDQGHCLRLLAKFSDHISAVIPVHLYGQCMEIKNEILENFAVIEDACQAHGALKKLQGSAACFSFYPSKNLGAIGDAGAVVTNSKQLATMAQAYVNYGDVPGTKYDHSLIGNNLRMDEIQAAFLINQLANSYLVYSNEKRIAIARVYEKAGITTYANVLPNSFHLYPILAANRKALAARFKNFQIDVGIHYPYTLSEIVQGISASSICLNADKISKHVLTLPIGPHMSIDDAEYVAQVLIQNAALNSDGLWEIM